MLKSWSIKNFKPIVDSGELQFAPVTVFAGRNSSGKSSLLQSILMITQTLGNRSLDRPLLPNERIVQLGTFENILNSASEQQTLHIGFTLTFDETKNQDDFDPFLDDFDDSQEHVHTQNYTAPQYDFDPFQDDFDPFLDDLMELRTVQIDIFYKNAKKTNSTLYAIEPSKTVLEKVLLTIDAISHRSSRKETKIKFSIRKTPDRKFAQFIENIVPNRRYMLPDFEQSDKYFGYLEPNTSRKLLIGLSHFLPVQIVEKFNVAIRNKSTFRINSYTHDLPGAQQILLFEKLKRFYKINNPIPENLKESIADLCRQQKIHPFTGQTFQNLEEWYQKVAGILSSGQRKVIQETLTGMVEMYIFNNPDLHLELVEDLEDFCLSSEGQCIKNASEKTIRFFASSIRYLGPLRADPQFTQKFSASSEIDDVGFKGEYAAVVYHTNKNAPIDWYNPQSQRLEQSTLGAALDVWAQYLKIADSITVEEAVTIGITWQVVPKKGQKARSLPELGVGISQILPILVMGLLSPAHTLLIIEQPELHLHPYVQARLGDFFMGLAKCKKQCLIETHSENLVSQLRLHIVQAGGLEQSDCMVYFVDQNEQGAAKFEKIEVSPNGNILNWPEGFFDETMLQEDRITAASLRKRAQAAKHGS